MPVPVALTAKLIAGIAAAALPEPVADQLAVDVIVNLAPSWGSFAHVQRQKLALQWLVCIVKQIYDVRFPGLGFRVLAGIDESGQSRVIVFDPNVDSIGRGQPGVANEFTFFDLVTRPGTLVRLQLADTIAQAPRASVEVA